MEKDRKEPVYTEQGYVYDYDEPVPEDPDEGASGEEVLYEGEKEPERGEQEAGKAGRAKRFLLPILAAAALMAGILAGAFLWGKMDRAEKIDLNRYVTIRTVGFDGYGRAEASVDQEALESDIAALLLSKGAIGTGEGKSRLEAFRSSEHYEEIMNAFRWILDREEDLSNGDVITLTMSYEPEDPGGYGLVCLAEPVLHTVSGLSEVAEVDPFEDLAVTVSGIGPKGLLSMQWEDTLPWTYAASSEEDLSNGDELLISVVLDNGMDEKSLAAEKGCVLTRTQMSYRVEGLPSYAADLSDLSDEISGELLSSAQEKVRQKLTEGYAPDEYLTDLAPAGTLLLCRRDAGESGFNKIFFLFRVSYSNRETALDYYYYAGCRDLVLYPDGTWTLDEEGYEYPVSLHGLFGLIDQGDFVRIDRLHAVTGFASPEDFYAACIEPLENVCKVSGELD